MEYENIITVTENGGLFNYLKKIMPEKIEEDLKEGWDICLDVVIEGEYVDFKGTMYDKNGDPGEAPYRELNLDEVYIKVPCENAKYITISILNLLDDKEKTQVENIILEGE